MATNKTLAPTNETIAIPAMSDKPDASVFSNCIDKTADAINALNSKIATYPTFKAFQIAANSSITLNISGSGRCVITAISGGNAGNARNMYICRASGNTLGIDELGNSSLISTSISGANLTLTSTIGIVVYLYVTIYYGDVTAI